MLVLLQHGSKRSDILSRRLDGWSAICRSEFLLPARAQVGRVRTVQAGGQIKRLKPESKLLHILLHILLPNPPKTRQNDVVLCSVSR